MLRRSIIALCVTASLGAGAALAQSPPPGAYPPPGAPPPGAPPPPGAIIAPGPPPPPQVEAVPPPPGPPGVMIWQPGYWRWDGRAYVWMPGVYVHRPRRHAVWIAPHWVPGPYGYVWEPGHWR